MTKLVFHCSDEKATALLKAARLFDEGAELEPVVRCKDCENSMDVEKDYLLCIMWGCDTDCDGFCHKAERKREND